MPHYSEYKCSVCNRVTLRELLAVKRIVFTGMGAGAKILKSRVVAHICNECLPEDKDYQREAFKGAPGMKSEPLERVRAIKSQSRGKRAT